MRHAVELGVLSSFSPISLHELLCVADDGFKSYVTWFLILGLFIVCFAPSRVLSLFWASILLFFFFPCFFVGCFSFIYLFIYLFDEIIDLCKPKRGNYWLQKPHLTLQPDLIDYKRVRNPREPKIPCCSFGFRNSLELRFYFNLNAFMYGNAWTRSLLK
jgi:hypothetical protein